MEDIVIIQGQHKHIPKLIVPFPICIISKPTCLIYHPSIITETVPIRTRNHINFSFFNVESIKVFTSTF